MVFLHVCSKLCHSSNFLEDSRRIVDSLDYGPQGSRHGHRVRNGKLNSLHLGCSSTPATMATRIDYYIHFNRGSLYRHI